MSECPQNKNTKPAKGRTGKSGQFEVGVSGASWLSALQSLSIRELWFELLPSTLSLILGSWQVCESTVNCCWVP